MENREQWKTEGDCTKCRREKYCRHQCRPNRERYHRAICYAVIEALEKAMNKPVKLKQEAQDEAEI